MNVMKPSHTSTTFGVMTVRMTRSHRYAATEKTAVMAKTPSSLMRRPEPSGIAITHTALMTSMLNAAEPTMVDGPSSPAKNPEVMISMTESKISGAEDPRAIRVRLATVAFHVSVWITRILPLGRVTFLTASCEVMRSMASMKRSAKTATPKKDHSSRRRKRRVLPLVGMGPLMSRPSAHVSPSPVVVSSTSVTGSRR